MSNRVKIKPKDISKLPKDVQEQLIRGAIEEAQRSSLERRIKRAGMITIGLYPA